MTIYLSMILGIIAANFIKATPIINITLTIVAILTIILIQRLKQTQPYFYHTLFILSLFLCCFIYATIFIGYSKHQLIQERIDKIKLNGVISSLIQTNDNASST